MLKFYEMKPNRPIVFLDVESAGADSQFDDPVELAILDWDGTTVTFDKTRRESAKSRQMSEHIFGRGEKWLNRT